MSETMKDPKNLDEVVTTEEMQAWHISHLETRRKQERTIERLDAEVLFWRKVSEAMVENERLKSENKTMFMALCEFADPDRWLSLKDAYQWRSPSLAVPSIDNPIEYVQKLLRELRDGQQAE